MHDVTHAITAKFNLLLPSTTYICICVCVVCAHVCLCQSLVHDIIPRCRSMHRRNYFIHQTQMRFCLFRFLRFVRSEKHIPHTHLNCEWCHTQFLMTIQLNHYCLKITNERTKNKKKRKRKTTARMRWNTNVRISLVWLKIICQKMWCKWWTLCQICHSNNKNIRSIHVLTLIRILNREMFLLSIIKVAICNLIEYFFHLALSLSRHLFYSFAVIHS